MDLLPIGVALSILAAAIFISTSGIGSSLERIAVALEKLSKEK
jgi:hypothetical protein